MDIKKAFEIEIETGKEMKDYQPPSLAFNKALFKMFVTSPRFAYIEYGNNKDKLPLYSKFVKPEIDLEEYYENIEDDEEFYEPESVKDGRTFERMVQEYFIAKFGAKKVLNLKSSTTSLKSAQVTKEMLTSKSEYKAVFEAQFKFGDFSCRTDVIVKSDINGYINLYEVKAVTKIKPEHVYDLFYQYSILLKLGYKIDKVGLIHINGRYVRKDADIVDQEKFLTIQDNFLHFSGLKFDNDIGKSFELPLISDLSLSKKWEKVAKQIKKNKDETEPSFNKIDLTKLDSYLIAANFDNEMVTFKNNDDFVSHFVKRNRHLLVNNYLVERRYSFDSKVPAYHLVGFKELFNLIDDSIGGFEAYLEKIAKFVRLDFGESGHEIEMIPYEPFAKNIEHGKYKDYVKYALYEFDQGSEFGYVPNPFDLYSHVKQADLFVGVPFWFEHFKSIVHRPTTKITSETQAEHFNFKIYSMLEKDPIQNGTSNSARIHESNLETIFESTASLELFNLYLDARKKEFHYYDKYEGIKKSKFSKVFDFSFKVLRGALISWTNYNEEELTEYQESIAAGKGTWKIDNEETKYKIHPIVNLWKSIGLKWTIFSNYIIKTIGGINQKLSQEEKLNQLVFLKQNLVRSRIEREYEKDLFGYETENVVMYDFETFKSPVPLITFTRAYQQVLSQYSAHTIQYGLNVPISQKGFERNDEGLFHTEYIFDNQADNSIFVQFAKNIVNDLVFKIRSSNTNKIFFELDEESPPLENYWDNGIKLDEDDIFSTANVFVAYNKSFEVGRLNELRIMLFDYYVSLGIFASDQSKEKIYVEFVLRELSNSLYHNQAHTRNSDDDFVKLPISFVQEKNPNDKGEMDEAAIFKAFKKVDFEKESFIWYKGQVFGTEGTTNHSFFNTPIYYYDEHFNDVEKGRELLFLLKGILFISYKTVDLAKFFQNFEIHLPDQRGKYSIKNVLPAIYGDRFSYKKIFKDKIQNGQAAAEAFKQHFTFEKNDGWKSTRQDLLDYCCLDTYAMVAIYAWIISTYRNERISNKFYGPDLEEELVDLYVDKSSNDESSPFTKYGDLVFEKSLNTISIIESARAKNNILANNVFPFKYGKKLPLILESLKAKETSTKQLVVEDVAIDSDEE